MQRIIEFSVDFDELTVKKKIEEQAYKDVVEGLKTTVIKKVISADYYGNKLTGFAEKVVIDIFDKFKDEIIERSAQIIAEKAMRSKAWREKFGDAMEGKTE